MDFSKYKKRYSYKFAQYYHHHWNKQLISLTDNRGKVLDYGCGAGILMKDLKDFTEVVGIDKYSETKGVIIAPGEKLPFDDNVFDVVFCRGVLHHLDNLEQGIKEIFRVLKPTGELILSEPNNDSLILRIPRKLFIKYHSHFNDKHKALNSKKLISRLEQAGFKIEVFKRFGFIAFPFGGLSDFLPVKFIPAKSFLIRLFIIIDIILSKIWFINSQSWHIIIKCIKL